MKNSKHRIENLKINDKVELRIYDHSSWNGGWVLREDELKDPEYEVCVVGYYMGSTKKSHRFGMSFGVRSNRYANTWTVLKGDMIQWRKLKP